MPQYMYLSKICRIDYHIYVLHNSNSYYMLGILLSVALKGIKIVATVTGVPSNLRTIS